MKTWIIKSLLSSLYQREDYFPSIKRGLKGVYFSLAKRGRFFIMMPYICTPYFNVGP
jgi:hypothetical protein